ncbi:hypothetical protein ABE504_18480 [Paenibacillus oryzisoli]|uniref:hypothetical protein n=1 Tax=Paenibacillus oryzisoli TaxID=1850517 RepID=UPI003D2E754A
MSCSESDDPRELYKKNDSVFIGKVKETTYEDVGTLNPKSRVTFEVQSVLKGNGRDNLTIVTTAGSEFLNTKEYLVYAYKTTKKNYLYKYVQGELATDTWCGGTKELSLASYDLEEIAELKKMSKILNVTAIVSVVLFVIITLLIVLKRNRKENDN